MVESQQLHEDYRRDEPVQGATDRAFGLTFAAALALIAAWSWWRENAYALFWLLGAAAFLTAALARPKVLALPNRAWYRFGLLLHRIVNPLIMAILFFAVLAPTGLLMQALGHDLLRLKWDRAARSYWIARDPPGPAANSMHRQF